MALQNDGKIIVGGDEYSSGAFDVILVRYNSDGSLDTSFSADGIVTTDFNNGEDHFNSIQLQADGKIVAAGLSKTGAYYDFALARFHTNGVLDSSFSDDGLLSVSINGNTDNWLYGLALTNDNKIIVCGDAVARFNFNGTFDSSFNDDGIINYNIGGRGNSIKILNNNNIIVGGGWGNFTLSKYNEDGSVDSSFGTNGLVDTDFGINTYDQINSIELQSDGKIVAAGYSGLQFSNSQFALARYNDDGKIDSSFGTDGLVNTGIFNGYSIGVKGQAGFNINVSEKGEYKTYMRLSAFYELGLTEFDFYKTFENRMKYFSGNKKTKLAYPGITLSLQFKASE